MSQSPKALFIFISLQAFKVVSAKTTEPFWITAELLSVHFKRGCLTTGICYNPAFKLSTGISEIKEKIGIDWDVNEVMEKKTSKQLITYWPKGDYNHVFIEASISGSDPQYNFPRLCDNAPGKHVFKASPFITSFDEEIWNNAKNIDNDIKLINLNGHCFNATISVKKHLKHCPWCTEQDENSIEVEPAEYASFWSLSTNSDHRLTSFLIFIFGLITLSTSSAFVVLLLLHLRQRRKIYKDAISDLNTTTRTIGSESQWSGIFVDQKCRPILRYVPTSHVEGKYGGGTMMIRPVPEKIMEDSQEGYEIIDTPHRHVRIPLPRRDRHSNHVEFHDYNSSASSYCSPISSTISRDQTPQTSPNTTIFEDMLESQTIEDKDKDSGLHSISPEREKV